MVSGEYGSFRVISLTCYLNELGLRRSCNYVTFFLLRDDLELRFVDVDGRPLLVSCVLVGIVSNTSPREVTEAVNCSFPASVT
jgi:hypothetical protein